MTIPPVTVQEIPFSKLDCFQSNDSLQKFAGFQILRSFWDIGVWRKLGSDLIYVTWSWNFAAVQ